MTTMTPSPHTLRMLEEMGLGPVWQRRASGAGSDVTDPGHGVLPEPYPSLGKQAVVPFPEASAPVEEDIANMDWDTLNHAITHCTRCRLCEGRTRAVPGSGDRKASWLFIGEGPGRTEDQQGEPFAGPSGQLLNNMLGALGLARGANTFIANVVKCRPVAADGSDRPPAADEVAACLPYLERQVALIEPGILVTLGKVAAVSMLRLEENTTLSSLRGKPYRWQHIPLVATYHPAYLLRKPTDKAKAWRDLCMAKSLRNAKQ